MKNMVLAVLILCATALSGCSTVKGAATGFAQDVKSAGKGIKIACKKIAGISGLKNADDKFKEIAW